MESAVAVVSEGNNALKFNYVTNENGAYQFLVFQNEKTVQGSPFMAVQSAANGGLIRVFGPGLSIAKCGQNAPFTILYSDVKRADITVAVEGPSEAELTTMDAGAGAISVNFMPLVPGIYKILVRYKAKPLDGFPLSVKVVGDPLRRSVLQLGNQAEFGFDAQGLDLGDLTATIKSPNGSEVPCAPRKLANGKVGVVFSSKVAGDHLVNVYKAGKPIEGSPFKVTITSDKVGNASKITVDGPGVDARYAQPVTKERNKLVIDARKAGQGTLQVTMEGPSRPELEGRSKEPGLFDVYYKVTEPGVYSLAVKYADETVPKSPFSIKISGDSRQKKFSLVEAMIEPMQQVEINSRCQLTFKFPSVSLMDMVASVTDPNGTTNLIDMADAGGGRFQLFFPAKEVGIHHVSVKHRNMHVQGSPFAYTVGPLKGPIGAHRVRIFGDGLCHAYVDKQASFDVYHREAGGGKLEVSIEGPSKADLRLEQRYDGSYGVDYTVSEHGEYRISVRWNGEEVPDSPSVAYVSAEHDEARKLTVAGLTEKNLSVGKPVSFTVRYNGAKGTLVGKVVSPGGDEDEATVAEVDEADQYVVRFVPKENGPHLVSVHLESEHIPGSPFWFLVGKYDADPGMVHANGDGLLGGKAGEKCKFLVNTVNAGAGVLSVAVEGPGKVQLSSEETDDGYRIAYSTKVGGKYLIAVKYGGNFHIVGSPFLVLVEGGETGAKEAEAQHAHLVLETAHKTGSGKGLAVCKPKDPKPENVHCKGMGLKRAFIGKSSQFTIETKDAGVNALLVGLLGPEHMQEEVNVKRTGKFQYTVSYIVREKGVYQLYVLWGDQHVSESPFSVEVS